MGPVLLFVKICMLLSVAYSGGICYTRRTISFIPIFMSEQYDLLKSILLEKSVRTGTFTLASGKVSDLYVDCRMTAMVVTPGMFITQLRAVLLPVIDI